MYDKVLCTKKGNNILPGSCLHFLFSVNERCGGTTAENVTYFASSGNEAGTCNLKVCKCQDNICQVSIVMLNTMILESIEIPHSFGPECLPLESLRMYGLIQLFFMPVLAGGKISFQ